MIAPYTKEEILAREPDRELDALIAKIMGWTGFSPIDPEVDFSIGINGFRRNYAIDPIEGRNKPFPLYSKDTSAVWPVEERIKELGLRTNYVSALKLVLSSTDECVGMFDYLHANPEQRCKAALLAIHNL